MRIRARVFWGFGTLNAYRQDGMGSLDVLWNHSSWDILFEMPRPFFVGPFWELGNEAFQWFLNMLGIRSTLID